MSENIILKVSFDGADVTDKKTQKLAQSINELAQSKSDLNKQIKKLDKTSDDYASELNRLTKEQSEVNAKLKVAKKEYTAVERATIAATVADRQKKDSLVGLRSQLSLLTNQYDRLSKAERDNANIGGKLQKQIKGLSDEIGKIEGNTGRFQRSVGNYGKAFKGLGRAISVASGAFAAITAIIRSFTFFTDFSKDIGEANKLVESFTGLTGDAAKGLGSLALAISETYGADTKDVLQSANNLSKQFGITTEEALQKINLGFAAGLNANGEFLHQLKEYPVLLKEVGLSADETFNLIQRTVESGVYSDKGIDAIKEAGIALRELTKPTREALDGIGLSSDEIERSLSEGTKSIKQVISEVSAQMATLPPQSAAVGTAIADIFKGAGEDAGLDFLLTLQDINGEFTETNLNLTEAQQAQLDLANAQTEVNDIFNEYFGDSSIGFTKIKTAALGFVADSVDGIKGIVKWFKNLYNESEAVRIGVGALGAWFGNIFGFAKLQVENVIDSFKTLIETISFLLDGEFSKAADAFTGGFSEIGKKTVDFYKGVGNDIVKATEEATDARLEVLTDEQEKEIALEKEKQKKIEEAKAIAVQKEAERKKKQQQEEAKALKEKIRKDKEAEKAKERAIKKAEAEAKKEERDKLSANKKLEDLILNAEQEAALSKIENKRELELKKLEIARDARKQEIKESLADDEIKKQALLAIDNKYNADRTALIDEQNILQKEKDEQESVARKQTILEKSQEIGNSLLGAIEERANKRKEVELNALNEQLNSGAISQEEFEKKKEEIERVAFEKKKKRDISSIIANSLVGASKTIAQLGFIGALPALAALGVQTGVQIAGVQAQTFADGGFTGEGVAPADHTGQRPVGIVHEREFVANRHALATPRGMALATQLNSINQNPALGYFADGGFTSRQIQIDEQGMAQAIGAQMNQIKVVNVASETSAVDSRTKFVRNKGRI